MTPKNLIIFLFIFPYAIFGQTGTIKGKVTTSDLSEVFANVVVDKTSLGARCDRNGNFIIPNVPEGKYTLIASAIGYETVKYGVNVNQASVAEVNFVLYETFASLNEVVVTATRTDRRRLESAVAVNVLDSKTFSITQSNTLSDGMCFQPGLRMETDCQTCNYTQLRMNGLGGSYSQILINSRPVFTSLMSLYGLEQIPANMIERVEVVRGGGSVLFGSTAIAGTVNVITKVPKESSFTLSSNTSIVDKKWADNFFNANVTTVNDKKNAGVSFFASHRDREPLDFNNDGYSEISQLINNSFGFNSFFNLSPQSKLEVNGWSIYEERQGGNKLTERADKADQSEYRLHNIVAGGINYEYKTRNEKFSVGVYGSGQDTKRTHYTGIDQSDGWGTTKNYSFQGGVQLNYVAENFLSGKNVFTLGAENQHEYTFDQIKAYGYLIDQRINLASVFLQSDWDVARRLTMLWGVRINKHNLMRNLIVTPRIGLLFKSGDNTQFRLSYARGFKAPQAFETDMHIAFAAGGVSLIKIDPTLREETSGSFNASIDFNKAYETFIYGFTIDGFHTLLNNAFVLEEAGADSLGNKQLWRKNGGNTTVAGVTVEGRVNYNQIVQLEAGITFQKSEYDTPLRWSAELDGTRQHLRSPDLYGYYTLSVLPKSRFNAAITGVLTGPMKVPHFAGAPGVDKDVVITSPTFFENNLKVSYRFTIKGINQDLRISAGVQNIFNEYQNDFDTGKNRDSNYIYGPAKPRTFFFELKFGLM